VVQCAVIQHRTPPTSERGGKDEDLDGAEA